MNFSFNFKPVRVKHKENVTSIFQKAVIGKVIEECIDETFFYFVLVGEIKYPISSDSYVTKKKKIVYFKEKNNKWGSIIRLLKEDRVQMPPAYLPFRPGYEVVGDIITENLKHVFKIKGCYKPNSAQKAEILKEIENEEECQV